MQSHKDLSRRATREVSTLRKKQVRAGAKAAAAAAVAGISAGEIINSEGVENRKKKKRTSNEEANHQRTDIMIQIKQHDGDMHLAVAKDEQRMVEVVRVMLVRLPSNGVSGGGATSQG